MLYKIFFGQCGIRSHEGKTWGGRQNCRFVLVPAFVICQWGTDLNALKGLKKPRTPPTKHLELSSVKAFKGMQLLCNLQFLTPFAGCEGAYVCGLAGYGGGISQLVKWSQPVCCSNNFDVLYCLMSSGVFSFFHVYLVGLPSSSLLSFFRSYYLLLAVLDSSACVLRCNRQSSLVHTVMSYPAC